MSTPKTDTDAQWRRVIDLAITLKNFAPWRYFEEPDVFAVRDPEDGAHAYVTVLGSAGTHLALAAYLGEAAFTSICRLYSEKEQPTPRESTNVIFDAPQLQVSYGDSRQLPKTERDHIKRLGYRFAGPHAWPHVIMIEAGFGLWQMPEAHLGRLTHIIEQALDVLPRFKDAPEQLAKDGSILFRVPTRQTNGTLVWRDEYAPVPPPKPPPPAPFISPADLHPLRGKAAGGNTIALDLCPMPHCPIQERKTDRPRLPYLLLAVDVESDVILGTEMLVVEKTFADLLAQLPAATLKLLQQLPELPRVIHYRSPHLETLLTVIGQTCGIVAKRRGKLPNVDAAMDALEEMPPDIGL